MDETVQTITFIGVLKKRTIAVNDISNYYTTIKNNGFRTFYGLLLKLKDNTEVQLQGQNLRSIDKLKDFLIKTGVTFLGETKAKFPFN